MASNSTMTIRLPQSILERLAKLAKATERSKSYLATKAIEAYIATQEWQIQAIDEAVTLADSPEAEFVKHNEVVSRMKKRIAARKRNSKS